MNSNNQSGNKSNNSDWGTDRPQSRHTSTLNIPIKTPTVVTGAELGEGRRRQQHDILSHEIDRMNARMRDLRKSFEDLTTASSSASTSSRVKNNFFERSSIQHQQQQQENLNSTMPSIASHHNQPNVVNNTTTLPRKGLTSGSAFGGNNINSKDDFEREVENFRRNFQEFRHSSSASNNHNNMISRGSGLGGDPTLPPLTLPPPPLPPLDWDGAQTYVEATDGGRKLYRVTLDMNDFSPPDIKVKVVDGNILRVSAKTDRATSRGGNVQREFNREFTIPPDVDVDALVSRIDGRGVMTLEAPVKLNALGVGTSLLDSPPKFRSSTSSTYNATSTSKLGSNTAATLHDDDRFDSRPARRKYSWTGSLRNFPTSPPTTLGTMGRDRFQDLEGSSLFSSSTLPPSRPPLIPSPPSHLNSTALSDGPFKMSFDMRDYAPEEIKISVTDNMLKVRAKHEEKSLSGTVSREFNREYTIPRHVNPDTIKSVLGRDGTLTIESISNSITNSRQAFSTTNGGGSVNSSSLTANDSSSYAGVDQSPFKLRFDMAAYQPDEIKVKVTGGMVRVEARHQEIHPERGNILREFSREYVIPKGIDPDQLRSSLSPSGILTIEAATAIAPF